MAKLAYTPYDTNDWKNHPRRIYVSCHPQDRGLYERISADIRRIVQDCVIAVLDPEQDPSEIVPVDELEIFHLVVFAITPQWLADANRSADEEFDYAAAHHLAVLPILFDDGLVDAFNAKANGVQCLRVSDPEYAEKLDRALRSTLLFDDSLLAQVKEVFTHHMFISYCRQDVEKTKQLLRIIHKRESFRRIAVWYDKYITAGRYFEDIIFAELDGCDIFGMAVTPTLIHRPTESYVLTNELPRAVKRAKQIICFEMDALAGEEKTALSDKCKLRNVDISAYPYVAVDKDRRVNEKAVEKAVAACLKNKGAGAKNTAAEQAAGQTDYLLGLAYLNGIMVEFDPQYARKKFEKAAAVGNLEAVEQLVNMYRYGKGVGLSLKQAIHWRTVAVSVAKKRYEKARTEYPQYAPLFTASVLPPHLIKKRDALADTLSAVVNEYLRCLLLCGDLMRDAGQLTEADKPYTVAAQVWEESSGWGDTRFQDATRVWVSKMQIVGRQNLLDMKRDCSDPTRTAQSWEECWAQYEQAPDNREVAAQVVTGGILYAGILLDNEKADAAREVLDRVRPITDRLERGTMEYYTQMVLFHRAYGRSYLAEPDGYEAAHHLKEAMDLCMHAPAHVLEENPVLRGMHMRLHVDMAQAFLLAVKPDKYAPPAVTDDNREVVSFLLEEALKHLFIALCKGKEEETRLGNEAVSGERAMCFLEDYYDVFYWACYLISIIGLTADMVAAFCPWLEGICQRFGFLEERADGEGQREKAREKLAKMRHLLAEWKTVT